MTVLEQRVLKFFSVDRIEAIDRPSLPFAARTGGDLAVRATAYRAWIARVRNLAQAVWVDRPYSPASVGDLLRQLRHSMEAPEEVRHVPRILAQHGIRVLIVEQLAHTKLDGGCVWLDDQSPVVALTMRYDRLDWFWFTLLHEIGHVRTRDGRAASGLVDVLLVGRDAEGTTAKPPVERAADAFAAHALIDQHELDAFIARVGPLYSLERIRRFAKRVKVHPALVLGQLQHRCEIEHSHGRDMLRDKVRDIVTATTLTDGWGAVPVRAWQLRRIYGAVP